MAYWELKIASMSKTVFFKFVLLSVLLVGCSQTESLPFYNSPDFKPLFLSAQDAQKRVPHAIASFAFKNQMDQIIGTKDVLGKVHIANFMFTQCGSICPIMTNNMKKIQDKFLENDNLMLLSISVTPNIDNVETLKKYAKSKGVINSKWNIATGNKKHIYELARKSYFAVLKKGDGGLQDFIHTPNFILIDKKKQIRGIYNGTDDIEIKRVINDIKTLQIKNS